MKTEIEFIPNVGSLVQKSVRYAVPDEVVQVHLVNAILRNLVKINVDSEDEPDPEKAHKTLNSVYREVSAIQDALDRINKLISSTLES